MSDYTLREHTYEPDNDDLDVLENHTPEAKEDWSNTRYDDYKAKLRSHYYYHQLDRCAYCRKTLEAGANYEPIDHIVPKADKLEWLLHPMNLIVTCNRCNNRKGKKNPLTDAYLDEVDYPDTQDAFLAFHPHFDNWADHLAYENDIFLVPVQDSKGQATIDLCRLDLKNIIINKAKELKLRQKEPMNRITHKLIELNNDADASIEMKTQLLEALQTYHQRCLDNELYD